MSFINSPGPGQYEHKSQMGRSAKYTMRPKYNESERFNAPGPGNYDPKHKQTQNLAPSYTMRKRTTIGGSASASTAPGPGAYQHVNHVGKAPAKSMTARRTNGVASFTPGPGAYAPGFKTLPKAPGYSLTGRNSMLGTSFSTPGPGSYGSKSAFSAKRGFTMTSRNGFKDKEGVPGPGQYNASHKSSRDRAPVFTMRMKTTADKSTFFSSTNQMPGVYTVMDNGARVR